MAAGIALSDRQRLDWLRLIRSEGIGPRSFRSLMKRFGGAGPVLEALPDLARQAGRAIRICPESEAEREMAGLIRLGGRFIALGEADYPRPLQAIDSAPPLFALMGNAAVLCSPAVAMVGSRNASAAGLTLTRRLAREIGEAGFAVVSGLARGIDTAAHEASLATGTVAVLAGGLDRIYPPQNSGLAERIAAGGALVSEMPLGWEPRARDFPRRNRIVSGLALGTVVVEAARRSGSLITARFANEQGRQVFAVPGSPLDPRAEGGNHLIREGATLCAAAAHVVEALQPMVGRPADLFDQPRAMQEDVGTDARVSFWDELDLPDVARPPFAEADRAEPDSYLRLPLVPVAAGSAGEGDIGPHLLGLLSPTPIALDDLVRASGHSAREVGRVLVELELAGAVLRHPGGGLSRPGV
ncbi:DNA-processing protein DprA [Bosea thiooxidans]|nr:DNA-processing protein DprA [Bosea sp. (in: a-proteobacteria)]